MSPVKYFNLPPTPLSTEVLFLHCIYGIVITYTCSVLASSVLLFLDSGPLFVFGPLTGMAVLFMPYSQVLSMSLVNYFNVTSTPSGTLLLLLTCIHYIVIPDNFSVLEYSDSLFITAVVLSNV